MVREHQVSGPPELNLCVFCWYQGWLEKQQPHSG